MKKIFIFAALLMVASSLNAAQSFNNPDDVQETKELKNKHKSRPDFDFPFIKIKERYYQNYTPLVFGMGFLTNNSSTPFDFSFGNSLDIFFYQTMGSYGREKYSLSTGFGLTWKLFTLTGKSLMLKDEKGNIVSGVYPDNSVPKLSRLGVFSLSFPVLAHYNFYKHCRISAGPLMNLNIVNNITNKYYIEGKKHKDVYRDVHGNFLTFDMFVQITVRKIGLYAKYSPQSIMDKQYWQKTDHWSAGIIVIL